jgi:signal transduction histidine kinase/tetratricopeptide (TPR) repeat protein
MRNKIFYLLLLFLPHVFAHAQTNEIDSLKKLLLTETKDTSRVMLLGGLSYAYSYSKPDTALLLAQQGLSLARKAGFTRGEAFCLNVIGNAFLNTGNYPKALENYLESLKKAESISSEAQIANVLGDIGDIFSSQGDYRQAINYFLKSLAAAQQLHRQRNIAIMFLNLGDSYEKLNILDSAMHYTGLAYSLSVQLKDADLTGVSLNNLGNIYSKMGQDATALNYYRSDFPFLKQAGDDEGLCETYLGMAKLFQRAGNTDSCLHYAKLSLFIAKNAGFTDQIMYACNFLTNFYRSSHQLDSAFTYQSAAIVAKDSLFSQEKSREIQGLAFDELMRQQQIEETKEQARTQIKQNALIGGVATLLIVAFLLMRNNRQKRKANALLQKQKEEIDNKAKELSVQKDNVELLGEIGKKISSSLSVEKIISTAYDNVNALMDANIFGIGIYNDNMKRIEFPSTYENGQALPFYFNSVDDRNRFGSVCFTTDREIIMGNLDKEYMNYIQEVTTPHEGEQPVSIIFLPLTAKEQKLGVITVQSFKENAYSDYHLFMLRNIATYTAIAIENAEAYETLNETVSTLRSTQSQLIQAEKMASLGELTAGIAHEIQNPLNFVNNFSEVNKELIEELEGERSKVNGERNEEVESVIIKDIKNNEEKIIHHGKRADAIVKNMLQHSRQTKGVKEPTDINALCDEYLRLSYYGMRAKDKNFNADFKTDFTESIGKINVVPQDIGRVLLNLFNNAFYAVNRSPHPPRSEFGAGSEVNSGQALKGSSDYEPTVSISTKRLDGKILISVKDNGPGIPQNIVDKIFQPFFTTKPTGQGTGLGLSLGYDIIKAHAGEIKVETKEGAGSEFVIQLPV